MDAAETDVAGKTDKTPEKRAGTGGAGAATFFFVAALLVAPVLGVLKSDAFGRPVWVFTACAVLSLLAFFVQWFDKRRAESEQWRVPENFLHLLELLGGWPGAFIAQRLFRHKTSKFSYQFVFWLIVAVHELVAVDFLLGWKMAQALKAAAGL